MTTKRRLPNTRRTRHDCSGAPTQMCVSPELLSWAADREGRRIESGISVISGRRHAWGRRAEGHSIQLPVARAEGEGRPDRLRALRRRLEAAPRELGTRARRGGLAPSAAGSRCHPSGCFNWTNRQVVVIIAAGAAWAAGGEEPRGLKRRKGRRARADTMKTTTTSAWAVQFGMPLAVLFAAGVLYSSCRQKFQRHELSKLEVQLVEWAPGALGGTLYNGTSAPVCELRFFVSTFESGRSVSRWYSVDVHVPPRAASNVAFNYKSGDAHAGYPASTLLGASWCSVPSRLRRSVGDAMLHGSSEN